MNTIQYDAQADSIQIEDITTNVNNRIVLGHVKRNKSYVLKHDPDEGEWKLDLNSLNICDEVEDDYEECCYAPEGVHDMGWLGYFVGRNNHLKELRLYTFNPTSGASVAEVLDAFIMGVSRNKSITRLDIRDVDLSGSSIFNTLSTFFKNNNNLIRIDIHHCNIGVEGSRALALAIGSCKNGSLKKVSLRWSRVEEGLADIITALSMHPNLETLSLDGNCLRANSCTALSTLLQHSCTKLNLLSLENLQLDDEGIKTLIPALKNCNQLKTLWMAGNDEATARGWQRLAAILEVPNSKLESLDMTGNNIDDQTGAAFARALANNNTLGLLHYDSTIRLMEQEAFSKLLCDTSSIQATYLSNHTLKKIGSETNSVAPLQQLVINRSEHRGANLHLPHDEKRIAMIKILQHHNDFDMMPFFEWEFKVLPLIINWFERASRHRMPREFKPPWTDRSWSKKAVEPDIGPRKLSCIYQFVRGMPLLYVETRLRKELEDIKVAQAQMEVRKRDILERLGRNA